MQSLVTGYTKVRAINETSASFPLRPATTTRPSGTGVLNIEQTGRFTRTNVMLVPYGVGADNATMNARVIAWREASGLWIPTIACQVAGTLSAAVGVTTATVLDTERFADTLTLTFGTAGVDCTVLSPANDTPAHVVVNAKGATVLEVVFSVGTATSANGLIAYL